jgi:tetratricopeptide (TPR) repeat protein
MVLVDTGSGDRTRSWRAPPGKVVDQPWADDFSAPRNECLRHASGDWILQLDCDERLAPGAGQVLREEVRRPGPPAGLLPLHDAARIDAAPAEVVSGRARLGEPLWLPRLLRRLPDLRWEGVVHESVTRFLVAHGSAARRVRADIVHLGAVPDLRRERHKSSRNIALLERRCAANRDDLAALGLLAQELLGAGRLAEARAAAESACAARGRAPGLLATRAAVARAISKLRAGEAESALETAREGAARDGEHPDLSWLAGKALEELAARAEGEERRARLSEAERAHRAAAGMREAVLVERCVRGSSGWLAQGSLGTVLLQLGRPAEAAACFEEALREKPDLAEARLGLAEAALDAGEPGGALALCEALLGAAPDGWVLAAAAARAAGAEEDARMLLARAREREGRGFVAWHRRERMRALEADAATPTATPTATPASTPTATSARRSPSPPPSPPLVRGRGGLDSAATSTGGDHSPPRRGSGEGRPSPTAQPVPRRFAVTVVSPPGYPHAAAFQEAAEGLHHGLRALGHDSVLGTDLDLPGRQHVLLGANLLRLARRRPPEGAILYNLEQVQEGSPWFDGGLLDLYRRHRLWDYSRVNADALVRLGVARPALVPVGWVPELERIAPSEEDVDVLFYGSVNERRRDLLAELERRGARVCAACGVYGASRDRLVARSRIVLNVHFYEARVFELVRVSYLLANGRFVVSERGADPEEERPFEAGVAFAPYERLADRCLELLARPDERRRIADAGRAAMRARPQAELLRAALAPAGAA